MPDRRRRHWLGIGAAVALTLLVIVVQIRWSPRFSGMGSDSGMFAYIGSRILEGDLPYRDVFDTKPPGVFYVNALAQMIGGPSPWAIWGLGAIWISAAVLILFSALQSFAGVLPAFCATAAFILTLHHPSYYQGGNLTEVYALLPQAVILAAAVTYSRRPSHALLFLAGAMTAAAVLFKPTYMSLGLAFAAVAAAEAFLARQWRQGWLRLAVFALGFALPLAGVALSWAGHGAFGDLWDAVVRFNFVYSSVGFSLQGMYGAFRTLFVEEPLSSLTPIAVAGAALLLWNARDVARARRMNQPLEDRQAAAGAVAVAAVAVPIEWAMLTVSGRNFGHYFVTPLPAMCTVLAYFLFETLRAVREKSIPRPWAIVLAAVLASLGIAWLVEVAVKEVPRPAEVASILRGTWEGDSLADPLVQRITELSEPTETVFVWADHPELNFLSGRRAPSRYVFSLHLLLPGTGNSLRFAELLEDLRRDPPALVLTQWSSSIGVPFLGAPRDQLCLDCTAEVREGVLALADYLRQGYIEVERIGEWVIFGQVEE
jgi:hypothetical protein